MLGAFLGQFYKIFVLVPVIALIAAAELAGAVYCGCGLLRPLWHFALMATSLQIGYVAIPVSYAVLDLLLERIAAQSDRPRVVIIRVVAADGTAPLRFARTLGGQSWHRGFDESETDFAERVVLLAASRHRFGMPPIPVILGGDPPHAN